MEGQGSLTLDGWGKWRKWEEASELAGENNIEEQQEMMSACLGPLFSDWGQKEGTLDMLGSQEEAYEKVRWHTATPDKSAIASQVSCR